MKIRVVTLCALTNAFSISAVWWNGMKWTSAPAPSAPGRYSPLQVAADLSNDCLSAGQELNAPLAQRRELVLEDIEAIVQVFQEASPLDGFPQNAIGRGYHALRKSCRRTR